MLRTAQKIMRRRRARAYLSLHPEDAPAVETILFTLEQLAPRSARDVAEVVAGREFSDIEWSKISLRWERAWSAIK